MLTVQELPFQILTKYSKIPIASDFIGGRKAHMCGYKSLHQKPTMPNPHLSAFRTSGLGLLSSPFRAAPKPAAVMNTEQNPTKAVSGLSIFRKGCPLRRYFSHSLIDISLPPMGSNLRPKTRGPGLCASWLTSLWLSIRGSVDFRRSTGPIVTIKELELRLTIQSFTSLENSQYKKWRLFLLRFHDLEQYFTIQSGICFRRSNVQIIFNRFNGVDCEDVIQSSRALQ